MKLIIGKTKWETPEIYLDEFLSRVKFDRFDAAELYIPGLTESASEVREHIADHDLYYIADIATEGETPADHMDSFERHAAFAIESGAKLINSHTGRDFFPFEENTRIFERSFALAEESGIPFAHETHRSRALYSAIDTARYLQAIPELCINADFSHWMNVHESDIRDQMHNVDIAIERAIHIHARIGWEESAQVNDPRAPEWKAHVDNHLDLWQRIYDARTAAGADTFTITPEFGPWPYMPAMPYTEEPLADTWEVNCYMRDLIRSAFAPS